MPETTCNGTIPSKNIPGIPAESCRNSGPHLAGLVWNSRWIPGGFRVKSTGIRWNPPELLPAFSWYSAGIPDYSDRNSAGIIAGIPPVFHRKSGLEFRRNYCRHSSGIPPEFRAGIPRELLPAFPRYSAGIIAGIPPVFHRNYCRHSPRHSTRIPGRNSAGIIAGISPVFHRNSRLKFHWNYCQHSPGIPPEFWAEILPELLPTFSRYSTGILAELLPALCQYS